MLLTGCGGIRSAPQLVWGDAGVRKGELNKPRAVAIDKKDRLYLVDWTARIQVYNREGKYLGLTWNTPAFSNGRPSGLSMDKDGKNLIVSDSHYSCIRIYTPEGEQVRVIGGKHGSGPGEFGYISDTVQDADGFYYVSEFGLNERISKLDPKGEHLASWGGPGSEAGQFAHIRALALGPDGHLYVADACNHRIQVWTRQGECVRAFGTPGKEDGELQYPYDLAFTTGQTPYLYVVEYGNHRVQKFTLEGKSLGCWGGPGREPGKLSSPWALAVDSQNCIHVIDSMNHRVQRIYF